MLKHKECGTKTPLPQLLLTSKKVCAYKQKTLRLQAKGFTLTSKNRWPFWSFGDCENGMTILTNKNYRETLCLQGFSIITSFFKAGLVSPIPSDPVGIQTQDLQNRNLTLYSAKLRDQWYDLRAKVQLFLGPAKFSCLFLWERGFGNGNGVSVW